MILKSFIFFNFYNSQVLKVHLYDRFYVLFKLEDQQIDRPTISNQYTIGKITVSLHMFSLALGIILGIMFTFVPNFTSYCQAQPKVQTKASAFGWDSYIIIIIQPPTYPDKYEGDEIEQNLENESCLSVWVDPKNVFESCPNLKNSQIRAKHFSISLFLC